MKYFKKSFVEFLPFLFRRSSTKLVVGDGEDFSAIRSLATPLLIASDGIIFGLTVGVRQQTAHTLTPASFTKVQCSHCHDELGGGGGGPREFSSSISCALLVFMDSLSPSLLSLSTSLSESASLEGSGGDGVRCLDRRDARDLTLRAGDGAREPVREAARDTARLSAAVNKSIS